MEGKVLFKTFASAMEAKITELKLEQNSIPFWVLNKKDSAYNTFGEIEIYINHDDLAFASTCIEQMEQ